MILFGTPSSPNKINILFHWLMFFFKLSKVSPSYLKDFICVLYFHHYTYMPPCIVALMNTSLRSHLIYTQITNYLYLCFLAVFWEMYNPGRYFLLIDHESKVHGHISKWPIIIYIYHCFVRLFFGRCIIPVFTFH